VDELKLTGLHSLDSKIVKPVRVKEAAIHMEAKLLDTLKVGSGPGSSTLVVGEIVQFHFSDHVYHEGTIDIGKLRPVSRLGGKSYGMTSGVFDLPRPKP
jgi:flavin reductase (DIM6/NTAB) family NADH-FMN oxidoreductase RutF